MNPDTLLALLGWAVSLSGYPAPDYPLDQQYVPQEWFVETMCGEKNAKKCKFVGGFLDADDPDTVYIHEVLEGQQTAFAASFTVHEIVHALQWASGRFEFHNCEHDIAREREAYYIQNEFLIANGHAPLFRFTTGACNKGK